MISYSPYTILLKLPFCISPCPETPPAKCDLTNLTKVVKSATKILKINGPIKNLQPKIILARAFASKGSHYFLRKQIKFLNFHF